ncbi:glycosyltransferase family 2 protein [Flavihumibacter solisilvae]|nr:glycosyltransferase [Flavihumibacter solisilvae]
MNDLMVLAEMGISTRKTQSSKENVFSILIPTWNNLQYLKQCIKSLRKYSSFDHQIIVHVNEGKDGTIEWLDSQDDIDYTFSEKNLGVCYALNAARTLVDTNYILYMNDDMFVCPGWDKALWEEVEQIRHNRFFISATAIEPDAQSNCSIEADFGRTIQTFRESELLSSYQALDKADWNGATWPPNLVHKDIWDMVGGYSVEFSPGLYSDPDFSMKLWQSGIRLFKGVGRSRVYHFGSISTKRVKINPGYYQFIAKWGITSSTLTNYFLKRGTAYTGPLEELTVSPWLKFKNCFKRIQLLFNSYFGVGS